MAKRLISTGIGILILFLVMVSNNIVVFNIALTIIALIGIFEFYNAFRKKNIKPMALLRLFSGTLFIISK